MFTYKCMLCDKSYETQIQEKENVCPKCRIDYEISDDYVYGDNVYLPMQGTNNLAPSDQYVPKKITITKEISLGWSNVIRVDDYNKIWCYGKKKDTASSLYHKFSDIASYELYQDSDMIIKGGLGRAVAGGLLFGAVGAVVGGSTGKRKTSTIIHEMYIRISLKDISSNYIKIPLCSNARIDSIIYKDSRKLADQILSLFDAMVSQAQTNPNTEIQNQTMPAPSSSAPAVSSPADEIQKFKALLDCGAITEEEYEAAKKKILDF